MQYQLSDLVPVSEIQQILEAFYLTNRIRTEILDMESQVIAGSAPRTVYDEFPVEIRSEYLEGVSKVGRAIRLEDQDIATLFLGPFFHEEINEDKLRQQARACRVDETTYLEAARGIPILSKMQAEHYLLSIAQVLQRLAEKGLHEQNLKEMLATAQTGRENLQTAYNQLEAHIRERTEELQIANAALLESDLRFRVALMDTPVVVFNQDFDLRYTWVYNQLSYADQPIIGKTDAELFATEDAMRLTALKQRVMAAGLLTREEVSIRVGERTAIYDMTLEPLYDANGAVTGLTCAATDITERKKIEDQLQRRLTEREGIQRIAKGLLQKIGLDEVMEIVCIEAMQLTGAEGSAVLLLDKDGWLRLTHRAGSPEYNLDRLPVEGSFAGKAFQTGAHVWANRRGHEKNGLANEWQGYPWTPGLMSMLSVPLKVDMKSIGVLNILNKPGEITEEDIRIIDLFANQAAVIIEHARLQHQAEQLAVLEERQRLARELHDSVTQALYSVTLYADASRMAFSAQQREALEHNLQEVGKMAREAMYDMRLLIFELRPFMLEEEGLIAALRARLAAVEGRAGLKTGVRVKGERRLPIPVEEEIYHIVQEGLNNVVKHAEAREIQILVDYGEDIVRVEMIDDGIGFDPEAASQSGGVGLLGIRERVMKLKGSLEIKSIPANGTRLIVRIPA